MTRQFEWTRHRISAHRHRSGPWHRYHYAGTEPNVKVVANTNEEGLDYKFQYLSEPPSPEGAPRHTAVATDSLQRVQTYRFEGDKGLSRLVEHQRADGSVMRYKYDGFGQRYASIDPLERTVYTRLDGQGNITGTIWQPANIRTSQSYDESGRLIASEDTAGALTQYRYDRYQRLSEIEYPDGGKERYRYPEPEEQPLTCESPAEIEDARGGIKRFAYNPAGLLTRYTDCSAQTTLWDYDHWGQVISVTDAQDDTTWYERDGAGRIVAVRMPNGQTRRIQYDGQNNITRVIPDENAPESALEIGRDLWGRPIHTSQGGLSVQMEWDVAGRLSSLTNENGAHSAFIWDAMDRLTQETGFDGRLQRYGYDAAGQLGITGDGAGIDAIDLVTGYRYDDLGRLAQRQLPATDAAPAQNHRYEWDKTSRLKAVSVHLVPDQGEERLQSRVEFERDPLGRITAEVQCLYQNQASKPGQTPPVEHEHRIEHSLNPLGNRLGSQLQNLGEIEYLLYGAGHMHACSALP